MSNYNLAFREKAEDKKLKREKTITKGFPLLFIIVQKALITVNILIWYTFRSIVLGTK